ncbi:MAG: neutral/alkaline non-lysosomal ceramidase N-terminal domain-containing protein [Lentisphaeria bacterium]|nr:neutral/alkaline non-lysosomal ceramidase N-terminal domain-containing protein [Lentisphaeria bacterium]
MNNNFLIGWGEADITPENPKVELAGQYYQRLAQGIHSRIKTVALYLEKGDEQALMISLDVVNFPEELQERIRAAIHADIPQIAPKSIFLNAIHTHSAPYTRPAGLFRDWLPLDDDALKPTDYLDFLEQQILEAVRTAWTNRAAGGIAPAFGIARIGHCRRAVYADGTAEMYGDTTREDFVGMEAGEDSGVELLFTFDANRKPTGTILNIACPSQVMESTYLISSDYMGAARENLKEEFGADFHTLCQIGAAGCQSPRDLTRHYRTEPDFWHADGVVVHAERVRKAVLEAFPQTTGKIDFSPAFRHIRKRVSLPMRRASYADYVLAGKNLEKLLAVMPEKAAFEDFCRETHANEIIPNLPGPYDSKLHHFVQIQNNKAVISRYESQNDQPECSFDMQILRLGDCAIANNPFELYLVFGQMIKARAKAGQTFIVQLSGGSCGYLPSREAEQFGGYGGLIINGKVGSDGGCKLVDETVNAINQIFKKE